MHVVCADVVCDDLTVDTDSAERSLEASFDNLAVLVRLGGWLSAAVESNADGSGLGGAERSASSSCGWLKVLVGPLKAAQDV